MNTLIILLSVISALLIFSFLISISYGQIFEDQYLICDHSNVCQVINIDDYIDKDKADKLQHNFENNLDTFNLH